jgi:hypothetical protein
MRDKKGVVDCTAAHDVTESLAQLPAWTYPLPVFDPFVANLPELRSALEHQSIGGAVPGRGLRIFFWAPASIKDREKVQSRCSRKRAQTTVRCRF